MKTAIIKRFLCILIVSISLIGCGSENDSNNNLASNTNVGSNNNGGSVTFSVGDSGTKSYGSPYVIMHVSNRSTESIYNVSCNVNALKGLVIVDSGFAYFADGGTIREGQSAQDEAIFFNLDSHSEYDRVESECDWLNR